MSLHLPSVQNRPTPRAAAIALYTFLGACTIAGATVAVAVLNVATRHWPTPGSPR